MLRADLQLLRAVLAGRSLPEVAAASGQSETAVRTRLQQLLRRLRETALKEQTEGQEP